MGWAWYLQQAVGMQEVVGLSAWGVSAQEGLVSRKEGEGRQVSRALWVQERALPHRLLRTLSPCGRLAQDQEEQEFCYPHPHHFVMTAGWPGVQEAQLAPRPVSG